MTTNYSTSPDPLPSSSPAAGELEGGARTDTTEAPSSGEYGKGELEALRKFRDGLFGSNRGLDGAELLKESIKSDLKTAKSIATAKSIWTDFYDVLKNEQSKADVQKRWDIVLDSESEAA